jgi:hypothetical protein
MRRAAGALLAGLMAAAGPAVGQTPDLAPVASFGESCPSAWRGGSGQCWPGPGSRPVIRRAGPDCPPGWQATVGWCQQGLRAPDARVRTPAGCPDGWSAVGAYCQKG